MGCDIWPWMGMAPKPRLRAVSASLRVWSHVRVNTALQGPAALSLTPDEIVGNTLV